MCAVISEAIQEVERNCEDSLKALPGSKSITSSDMAKALTPRIYFTANFAQLPATTSFSVQRTHKIVIDASSNSTSTQLTSKLRIVTSTTVLMSTITLFPLTMPRWIGIVEITPDPSDSEAECKRVRPQRYLNKL